MMRRHMERKSGPKLQRADSAASAQGGTAPWPSGTLQTGLAEVRTCVHNKAIDSRFL